MATLHAALIDLQRTWIRTRVEIDRKSYGFIAKDFQHPLVHEANLAWVEDAPAGGAASILSDLDDAFTDTSVAHRSVLFVNPDGAYELQEDFIRAGFTARVELVMAKVGLPACVVNPDLDIRPVGTGAPEAHFRLVQQSIHAESGASEEESRQMNDVELERGRAVGERAFVGYQGDRPASTYTLWPRGIFALVGNVATLPEFRLRGIGRTMIFDACRRSVLDRCEYALLTTNLHDTLPAMYKTLGFEPVGELRGFFRRAR